MKNSRAHVFDIDGGYLVKSPCSGCCTYRLFPDCMDDCAVLDHLQTALAVSVSTSFNSPAFEHFTLQYEGPI
jgi:hypothetical protein